MLRRTILIGLACILLSAPIIAQTEKPLPAAKIMETAYAKAKETNKNVFLIFHATWCGFCKKLDTALESSELKKIFDDNFVIVHLDVMESDEKIAQFENPGGKALMDSLGGSNAGIPYFVFITPDGKTLANSNVTPPDNSNLGYPVKPEEIEAFIKILKIGAPKITEKQIGIIFEYLNNKPSSTAPSH